jgi:hypothetical protein
MTGVRSPGKACPGGWRFRPVACKSHVWIICVNGPWRTVRAEGKEVPLGIRVDED